MIDAAKGLQRDTIGALGWALGGVGQIALRRGLDADEVALLARYFYALEARRYMRSQAAAWFRRRS